ncbi:YgjV family protein [Clostridium thermobutyricum]|uniref:Bacterial inner membrane protein n=1 Tax=Clostridium thermobutyricum DSM 4928 TaxID=1121339 RepID=A0A1V4STZ7_9CLOT|nr:YgjV family protein [Clostridium thermobutyricum]OPX47367.1 hypothetical protein CLTHE_19300 [Clostridium thermobutyricum DSM 4928]
MSNSLIEWVGYGASAMVVVSLLCTSMVWLRILNTIGCLLFVTYGIIIGAYPVAISNGIIVIINAVNLYKLKKNNSSLSGD